LVGVSDLEMERSIRRYFRERPITILRPPMILGPRDSATLPLFRMASGRIRMKPGLSAKRYSFIGVDDLVAAIFLALEQGRGSESLYVASGKAVSDWELIASAAAACAARGVTLPAPQIFVRLLSMVVDAVQSALQNLSHPRSGPEVWPDRWVVDGSKFERLANWQAKGALGSALVAAHDYYVREGRL
jgi:nucleoside-diphosphate-sugar epimerase